MGWPPQTAYLLIIPTDRFDGQCQLTPNDKTMGLPLAHGGEQVPFTLCAGPAPPNVVIPAEAGKPRPREHAVTGQKQRRAMGRHWASA